MTNLILYFSVPMLFSLGWTQFYSSNSWIKFYTKMILMGSRTVRLYGAVSASLGIVIIYFHNVWSGPPILLTITGWVFFIEGAFCALFPNASVLGLLKNNEELVNRLIQTVGLSFIVLSGVLSIHIVLNTNIM